MTITLSKTSLVIFKDRAIDYDQPIRAYLNLHKTKQSGKAWYSIMQFGRVVAHADRFVLNDVKFNVNEEGRQRVISSKRKNVHATVSGYLSREQEQTCDQIEAIHKINYNPYFTKYFMAKQKPIHTALLVVFDGPTLYTV